MLYRHILELVFYNRAAWTYLYQIPIIAEMNNKPVNK